MAKKKTVKEIKEEKEEPQEKGSKKKKMKKEDVSEDASAEDVEFNEEPEEEEPEEVEEKKSKKKVEKKPKEDEWKTEDETTKNWMMVANATYIGAIVTYITTKERDDLDNEMVKFQAVQHLFMAMICFWFFPLYFVVTIIAVIMTSGGTCWEMPVFGEWTRKSLGMPPKEMKEEDDEE